MRFYCNIHLKNDNFGVALTGNVKKSLLEIIFGGKFINFGEQLFGIPFDNNFKEQLNGIILESSFKKQFCKQK